MSDEIKIPDIGDFKDVPVIDVLVKPGQMIKEDDILLTLESDKATLDVPSPRAGILKAVTVKTGDKVSMGSVIALIDADANAHTPATTSAPPQSAPTRAPVAPASVSPALSNAARTPTTADFTCDLAVLGAGPGGYSAAFRAADLGLNVTLIDARKTLGGVCLNVGCIPSKALLHAAKVLDEAHGFAAHGIAFGAPKLDIPDLRGWKDAIIAKLTNGLTGLAKQRKVSVMSGQARFASPQHLSIATEAGEKTVQFDKAIIACGSEPVKLPFIPHGDPRVLDSTGALELADIPARLLVLGGGIIGLEMATVYHALGSKITLVELMDQLIPGADGDIVAPLHKRIAKQYEAILLKTKVVAVVAKPEGLQVRFEDAQGTREDTFDKILVAVGRTPNGNTIGAEHAGVAVDARGFIAVDRQMRTNVPHIFAIGDVVGQPMLAHKATHEGKVAAEVASGHKAAFDAKVIPSVAYTDPEVAWVGLTESAAKTQKIAYGKGAFPWAASGRSLALGRDEGLTKTLYDPQTNRILGCGIVGPNAGELIAEAALAIEMGADAEDIGLTIHPHPTLSETIGMSAEAFSGTLTDLYLPRKS